MASKENIRARQLWEELLAALTPTDHEPTPDELRAGYDNWATTNFPTPPELRTEQVDADGVPCVWASMPGTSSERTIFYLHGGGYVVGSPTRLPRVGCCVVASGRRQSAVDRLPARA
jgi:acetyl esterase/lipase